MLSPGRGVATITFSSSDWANFLAHPLVTAVTPQLGSEPFRFLRQGKIETDRRRALFAGTLGGDTFRFSLTTPRETDRSKSVSQAPGVGSARPSVSEENLALVKPLRMARDEREEGREAREEGREAREEELAQILSQWFSGLEVDLDGARFRYNALRFPGDTKQDVLELQLSVLVESFPNPVTTTF
jgi:hypothetical protein